MGEVSRVGLVRVFVLGSVHVDAGRGLLPVTGFRLPRLLARLVVAEGRPVPSADLRRDVWPDEALGDSTLRVAVNRLRTVLGDDTSSPAVLRRGADGFVLDPTAFELDALRFEQLVAAARATGHPAAAAASFADALALWRGPPFGDLGDEPYLHLTTERWVELRAAAVEEHLDLRLRLGGDSGLLRDLEAAVHEHPFRERRTALFVLALYRADRQADALRAYRQLEDLLRDELGLLPGPELRRLEQQVLAHDPALQPSPSRSGVAAAARGVGDRALATARAATGLARAGAMAEAASMVSSAVAQARCSDDRATLARCLVADARIAALDGRPADGKASLEEASQLGRAAADGAVLAEAAIVRFGFGLDDGDLLVDLAEPLELLVPDAPQRVDLLAAAMHQVLLSNASVSAEPLVREAAALAERTNEPRARAAAAVASAVLAVHRRAPTATVVTLAADAERAAAAAGDLVLTVCALHPLLAAQLVQGDVDAVAATIDRFASAASASLLPFAVVRVELLRACVALATGQLDAARSAIAAAGAIGARMHVASTPATTRAQLGLLMMESGQLEPLAQLLPLMADNPLWLATQALVEAERGEVDAARAACGALRERCVSGESDRLWVAMLRSEAAWVAGLHRDAVGVARDVARNVGGSVAADVAAGVAADVAEDLVVLRAQSGTFAVLGHATMTLGPADRVAGLAALMLGDPDSAIDHLRRAVAAADAGGASLWAARSRVHLAHAHAVRARPEDLDSASDLLAAASSDGATARSAWLCRQHARASAALANALRQA